MFWIRLLLLLILAGALTAGILWFEEHPGEVVIEWLDYRIYTSVSGILVIAAIGLGVLLLALSLLRGILNFPEWWHKRRQARAEQKLMEQLCRGYTALALGDGRTALHAAEQAERYLPTPEKSERKDKAGTPQQMLGHMLAVQAARQSGNTKGVEYHLAALRKSPLTEPLALRGQLRAARLRQDMHEAVELAERLYTREPLAEGALSEYIALLLNAGRYQSALEVVQTHQKRHRTSLDDMARADGLVISQVIAACHYRMAQTETDVASQVQHWEKALKVLPGFTPVILAYAEEMRQQKHPRKANKAIEQGWKARPHPEIAVLYLEAFAEEEPSKRYKRAEKLVSHAASHPESHLLLAELAYEAGDIIRARNHLERAESAAGVSARLVELQLKVEEASESPDAARLQKLKWQLKEDLPDADWVCGACGATQEEWQITCGDCGAIGHVEWHFPQEVADILPALNGQTLVIRGKRAG